MQARWIRFDVPYSDDALQMRIAAAYSDDQGKLHLQEFLTPDVKDGLSKIDTFFKDKGIALDPPPVLIFPHDERHGLAWTIKEEADTRTWPFARHIPGAFAPDPSWFYSAEGYSTGSANKKWEIVQVYSFVKVRCV